MTVQFTLEDEAATANLANSFKDIVRAGDIIALYGDLGAGKTTFCKALIRSLLNDPTHEVPSPTFTLVQTYDGPTFPIWHFDMYRLEDPSEVEELGFEETVDGLALIEWPEKMGDALPPYRLDVRISFDTHNRKLTLTPHGDDWSARLDVLNK
jgi:tRNA threonylcarbamoyl adenosine modification protein YjeE